MSSTVKLLQLYNQYRSLFGGEETVVGQIAQLVECKGGEAKLLMRTSRGLDKSIGGKVQAFFSGIYNPFAYRDIVRFLDSYRPDVTHVHNLYPLFSPSVLVALRRAGIPVVMTVHNHFHTCPTADHLHRDQVCEKCVGGREYHCLLQNCRGNILESVGYALRSATARKLRLFTDNVTIVIALNEFAKRRLVRAGFAKDRVVVLPNSVDIPPTPADPGRGICALFSGRMCPEKGVATLLEAASIASEIPLRLLGDGPTLEEHKAAAPPSSVFVGRVPSDRVADSYRKARFLVVPSRWFEGCPLVILEAMAHGLPVIASRIGGLPELVDDGETGFLFEPGNPNDLADRMRALWHDTDRCRMMGAAGRQKAIQEYSKTVYWSRLQDIYTRAVSL